MELKGRCSKTAEKKDVATVGVEERDEKRTFQMGIIH